MPSIRPKLNLIDLIVCVYSAQYCGFIIEALKT